MARRYELSDASWELIENLVSPEQKMGRMIARFSTESCGSCVRALSGATCLSASGLGQRCISVFVTGATTARSSECWSVCTFE